MKNHQIGLHARIPDSTYDVLATSIPKDRIPVAASGDSSFTSSILPRARQPQRRATPQFSPNPSAYRRLQRDPESRNHRHGRPEQARMSCDQVGVLETARGGATLFERWVVMVEPSVGSGRNAIVSSRKCHQKQSREGQGQGVP
jgi:hypothetical protein